MSAPFKTRTVDRRTQEAVFCAGHLRYTPAPRAVHFLQVMPRNPGVQTVQTFGTLGPILNQSPGRCRPHTQTRD